jgi:hypothetical protein
LKKNIADKNFDQFDTNFDISSSESDNDRKPKIVETVDIAQMSHKNYLLNRKNKIKSGYNMEGKQGLESMI